ncbi:lipopolysaccharide biosynthesis protein [Rhizobium sp. R72]|uniref:GumC family protein n=1 Tax=unclassified Rhizobium TaxID=2613769 RepID=UPI000B534C6E|nr:MULTISPECIES: GumC family protein [unclassified Rhizobium]OWW04829.1 lipopolysaccharide biosynthesis protein [Rhizobium sp. R72]OWW05886.1 lipopolysaccharide biosynthesis protein [Rhizobium sp. R711]
MYEAAPRHQTPVISTRGWARSREPDDGPVTQPKPILKLAEPSSNQTGSYVFQELVQFDLTRILDWLRSGLVLIIALAILGMVAGYGVVFVIKPRFTAGIDLLVDPSNLRVVADDIFSESMQRDTQLLDVESKLRVLTSGNVLSRVISDLKLTADPEFVQANSKDPASDALRALSKRVTARRDERSFIVNIALWTEDAGKSVTITNAIASAFQEELAKAESEGAGRAASSLFARLADLKTEVAKAEAAVEAFKREQGLQSSSGELVSTLMSNQTNTQLIDAKARLIQAQSRYNELVSTNPKNRLNASALQSETMTMLRTQYSTLRQRVTSQSAVLGPRHPMILSLQPQLKALEGQIDAETARIVQAAKAELDQSRSALDALNSEANQMKSSVFQDTAAQIHLRELEREARAKATVYETFMARAGEAAERQQIDTTNVRIVSPAVVPTARSFPPRGYVLAGAGGVVGLALGLAIAVLSGLWRDYRRLSAAQGHANG